MNTREHVSDGYSPWVGSRNTGSRPHGQSVLGELARMADIRINGSRPWDIQVHNPHLYHRILLAGSLGFGDAYVDGWWDAEQLDETMTRILDADLGTRLGGMARVRLLLARLQAEVLNRQTESRAYQVGEQHYDLGNDLYRAMLDPTMSYSCAYWEHADTLEKAQQDKLEMICRKLQLQPGERLLDIGCGWGGLAEYAARTRGVSVLGVTISREQAAVARERCKGLPVEILLEDYRELTGKFDKAVSVGMFEHVGHKNYDTYFSSAARLLKDDGLFLLHTIGTRAEEIQNDPWIDRYIFPNGELPNVERLAQGFQPYFIHDDWHCFGQDYDRTLMAWWDNFDAHWDELHAAGYDQRFYRMWKYYLHSCAGFFRSRRGQLWQLVLSKPARREIYRSLRLNS